MKRYRVVLAISILTLLTVSVIALMSGSYSISFSNVIQTLIGNGTKAQTIAIMQLRLPRILVAILVGLALSTAGCVLQSITKNPLAEPGIIGINAGAALAIVIFISMRTTAYYSELSLSTVYLMPIVSIVGAFAAAVLIYLLSYRKGIKPIRLILVGIGVNAGINAVITLYQLNMSKGDYNQALTWISGSLWGSSWTYFKMLAPTVIVLLLLILYRSKSLDVLMLGEELATGLGFKVGKETTILLCLAVALSAVATSVSGNIAFLGLLGPHIARKLVGPKHLKLIPVAGFISAALIVVADTASRNLFLPLEIPVGITISIIGVPYFIYLMMRE